MSCMQQIPMPTMKSPFLAETQTTNLIVKNKNPFRSHKLQKGMDLFVVPQADYIV